MIDTLVLSIPRPFFRITQGDKFSPNITEDVLRQPFGGRAFQKYNQNPTKTELN